MRVVECLQRAKAGEKVIVAVAKAVFAKAGLLHADRSSWVELLGSTCSRMPVDKRKGRLVWKIDPQEHAVPKRRNVPRNEVGAICGRRCCSTLVLVGEPLRMAAEE